jgi:hypothetical protein
MNCTTAPQQGRTATAARRCSGAFGGHVWNASVGMAWAASDHTLIGSDAGTSTCTTKRRPPRPLGAPPS